MKYTMVGMTMVSLTGASMAQDTKKEGYADQHAVRHLVKAGDVIGSDLWDFHGNKIGTIDQVMLEPAGKTVLAIINADEWLEEDHKVAVPWAKIYVRTEGDDSDKVIYTLDVTKERLREAPRWEAEAHGDDPAKADAFHRFWGVEREAAGSEKVRAGTAVDRKPDIGENEDR